MKLMRDVLARHAVHADELAPAEEAKTMIGFTF